MVKLENFMLCIFKPQFGCGGALCCKQISNKPLSHWTWSGWFCREHQTEMLCLGVCPSSLSPPKCEFLEGVSGDHLTTSLQWVRASVSIFQYDDNCTLFYHRYVSKYLWPMQFFPKIPADITPTFFFFPPYFLFIVTAQCTQHKIYP